MSDVYLFQTNDDGEICIENGFVSLTGGLDTAAYLSLFGGNEQDDGSQNTSLNYWGNILENDKAFQYRSQTQYLLRSIPSVSSNLLRIEEAVLRDLQWMLDNNVASSIEVAATIPNVNRVNIAITILAQGDESEFNFTENWIQGGGTCGYQTNNDEGPTVLSYPVISGGTGIGQLLTCTTGTYTGSPTPFITRQWLRNGLPISGATGFNYTTVNDDDGTAITCEETATNYLGDIQAISNSINISGAVQATSIYDQDHSLINLTTNPIDLTGLDIDNYDYMYAIYARPLVTTSQVRMTFNNDVGNNYDKFRMTGASTHAASRSDDQPFMVLAETPSGGPTLSVGTITGSSDTDKLVRGLLSEDSGTVEIHDQSQYWTNTVDNMTSLQLIGTTGAINSVSVHIMLWQVEKGEGKEGWEKVSTLEWDVEEGGKSFTGLDGNTDKKYWIEYKSDISAALTINGDESTYYVSQKMKNRDGVLTAANETMDYALLSGTEADVIVHTESGQNRLISVDASNTYAFMNRYYLWVSTGGLATNPWSSWADSNDPSNQTTIVDTSTNVTRTATTTVDFNEELGLYMFARHGSNSNDESYFKAEFKDSLGAAVGTFEAEKWAPYKGRVKFTDDTGLVSYHSTGTSSFSFVRGYITFSNGRIYYDPDNPSGSGRVTACNFSFDYSTVETVDITCSSLGSLSSSSADSRFGTISRSLWKRELQDIRGVYYQDDVSNITSIDITPAAISSGSATLYKEVGNTDLIPFTLVDTIDVDGDFTAGETITVNGDADVMYKITCEASSSLTSGSSILAQFNGDTTASNYPWRRLAAEDSAESSSFSAGSGSLILAPISNDQGYSETYVYAKSGDARAAITKTGFIRSSSSDGLRIYSQLWDNSIDNITSIKIYGPSSLKAKIKIWKLRT